MNWYRAYVGTHSNPKFAAIARKTGLHRTMVLAVWQAVLECACKAHNRGSLDEFDADDVSAALDMSLDNVLTILCALEEKGMVDSDGVTAWKEKQYQSDNSTERVRAYRSRKACNADETLQQQDETPPDTDTDTDTDTDLRKPLTPKGERVVIPDWLPHEAWEAYCAHRGKKFTEKAKQIAFSKLEEWMLKGHDPGEILKASVMNGWKGIFEPKGIGNENTSRKPTYAERKQRAADAALNAIFERIDSEERENQADLQPRPAELRHLPPVREAAGGGDEYHSGLRSGFGAGEPSGYSISIQTVDAGEVGISDPGKYPGDDS